MFKSAATKIAHNSTLPALAINQDLRPLQDLITAEKAVILSLQRLATDLSKAAEALKSWGLGEGDDLGDILTASTTILTHFTSALSQYASHGHSMRGQLKAIRTREENLDELKRRRRNINSKADAAERKLNKMNPEHKHFVPQVELLNKLRDEIRSLDFDIMKDEAAVADFKRSSARSWVGLKFGGLIECCEKGVIAGEYGKLIVSEIPDEQTQPGLPRTPYLAHARIGDLVAEAHRCVNEVRLSTIPSTSPPPQQLLPQVPHVSDSPFLTQGGFSPAPHHRVTESYNDDRNAVDSPVDSSMTQSPRHHHSNSLSNAVSLSGRQADEFGNPIGPADTGGGRFATFPVQVRSSTTSGGGEAGPLSLLPTHHGQSDSFSSSVAQALAASTSKESESTPLSKPGRFSKDGPAPSYEASVDLEQSRSSGGADIQQSRRESDHVVEESRLPEQEEDRYAPQSSSEEPESSERTHAYRQGPQARLARLLQNEGEDNGKARNEQSLDAAAAREVGAELNIPSDGQQPTTPSSPVVVRTTDLERAPTYTEKPMYHGTAPSVGVGSSPVSPQQPQYSQGAYDSQQQYQPQQAPTMSPPVQLYQPGGMQQDIYPVDAAYGQGREQEFYNPYGEHAETAGGGGVSPLNFSPNVSQPQSALPSGAYSPYNPPQQQPPPVGPSSSSQGDNDIKPRSPLHERPPNAPYMTKLESGNRSTSSLGSLTPSGGGGGGGGGGKISAAAFKRPSPRLGSNPTSPLSNLGPASVTAPLKVSRRQTQQQQDLGEGQYEYGGAYVNDDGDGENGENGGEGRGNVGAGVGTYYYNGQGGGGGGGQAKFAENK